jgi:transposase
MTTMTHPTGPSVGEMLCVAFELGRREWKLALTTGFGVAPMVRTVASGDWETIQRVLRAARLRWGVAAAAPVVSCYEAGRDGFWIHRALARLGIANRVVDSSSIAVNRRARRIKTDRLDALKLVQMLVRVCAGECHVWREVHVPTAEAEGDRHATRERTGLVAEQTRGVNQLRSWLATYGCALPRRTGQWWARVRDWAGAPLPATVQARLARTEARLTLIAAQIAELDAAQAARVDVAEPTSALAQLVRLKGVAVTSATVLIEEGLVWRAFRNRREIGGLLGFAPAPYDSGDTQRDQGISRAGNARLQTVAIQLAWNWVRWQPASGLTRWYTAHFGPRRRARRIGIVALARKLVIALWRWATAGVLPVGAVLKPAATA